MTTIADNTDSRMNQNTQCSVLCCILFIFHHRPFPYLGKPTYVFHVLITTSSSVFLSRWPAHISIGSPMFSLTLVTTCLCSYFFITYLLDHILSHHTLQHSHLCSFKHVLLSLSRYPRITSIYYNRPRDGRCCIAHGDNTV